MLQERHGTSRPCVRPARSRFRPTSPGPVFFPFCGGPSALAGWFWLIALGLFLVLTGLYIHWSVVLLGALLPFVPVLAELLRRRRNRKPPP